MSAPGSSAGAVASARPGRLPHLGLHGVIAALWLLASALARLQEYAPHASLWFPPAAVTFAVGLTFGWRGLPGIVFASVLATVVPAASGEADSALLGLIGAGLAFGLVHGLAYILGARMLLRIGNDPRSPRAASALLLMAPLSALVATLGGLAALTAFGNLHSLAEARRIVMPFWIGDFVGVVALGPIATVLLWTLASRWGLDVPDALRVSDPAPQQHSRQRVWYGKLLLCLLPLLVSSLLITWWPEQAHEASFFVFFGLVPLTWIAHSEGTVRTYLACAVMSTAIAAVGALLGPAGHAVTYQFAMIILAGSAYFGLTVPLLYADNRNLRERLTTDQLTGAATRSYFLETAQREIERARRFGTPLSLLVFDLDHFKRANDLHGHSFGDLALATAVTRCRGELRAADLLARIGGEEFAVLLPMTTRADATSTAERLAAALRATPVRRGEVAHTLTASFGVTEVDPQNDDLDRALERADQALYTAKREGRDRLAAS